MLLHIICYLASMLAVYVVAQAVGDPGLCKHDMLGQQLTVSTQVGSVMIFHHHTHLGHTLTINPGKGDDFKAVTYDSG